LKQLGLSGIRQFFGLLNSSLTNGDAVGESDRPFQSEPADTGLASLLLLQSHLNMTAATDDILNYFARVKFGI